MSVVYWRWWVGQQGKEYALLVKHLAKELASYYDWHSARYRETLYEPASIALHRELASQYLVDVSPLDEPDGNATA